MTYIVKYGIILLNLSRPDLLLIPKIMQKSRVEWYRMTDKDLRKLKRAELIKLFLMQSMENDRLREELAKANSQLEDRQLLLQEAGSIAEASLCVNHVFEAAQEASEQYLENIKLLKQRTEEECARLEKESLMKAKYLLHKTQKKCQEMLKQTEIRCAKMEENAEGESHGSID